MKQTPMKQKSNTTSKPNTKNQLKQSSQYRENQIASKQCESNQVVPNQQQKTAYSLDIVLSQRVTDLENKLNDITVRQQFQNTQFVQTPKQGSPQIEQFVKHFDDKLNNFMSKIQGEFSQLNSRLGDIKNELRGQLSNVQAKMQEQTDMIIKIQNELQNIIPQVEKLTKNQQIDQDIDNLSEIKELVNIINTNQIVQPTQDNVQVQLNLNNMNPQQNNQSGEQINQYNQDQQPLIFSYSRVNEQQENFNSQISIAQQVQRKILGLNEYLQYLFNLSCRKGARAIELKSFITSNQGLKTTKQFEQMLGQLILDGFRKAQVDDNCFLCKFIFDYLHMILNTYQKDKFEQYLKEVFLLKFELLYEEAYPAPEYVQNYLKIEFIQRLQQLRNCQDQAAQLKAAFVKDHDIFFGFAMTYIKSFLVYRFYADQQYAQTNYEVRENFRKKVLSWESELEKHELIIVIDLLAKHLAQVTYNKLTLENIKQRLQQIAI